MAAAVVVDIDVDADFALEAADRWFSFRCRCGFLLMVSMLLMLLMLLMLRFGPSRASAEASFTTISIGRRCLAVPLMDRFFHRAHSWRREFPSILITEGTDSNPDCLLRNRFLFFNRLASGES